MDKIQAVVLAAGRSTRFNTKKSKLIETICGQEMILYPTRLLESLKIETALVVGYKKEDIIKATEKYKNNLTYIEQKEQLGTGHAVAITKDWWHKDHILIMNGDAPLIKEDTITRLWEKHTETDAAVSFVVAHNIDPSLKSYGRVIEEDGKLKIVEAKDDVRKDRVECCVNAGIYIVKKDFLVKAIDSVEKSSVTGEFYITKLIEMANDEDLHVETITESFDTIRGINTLRELWVAEQIKRSELIQFWMNHGVKFSTAQNTIIDLNVKIGQGVYVGPSIKLTGNTEIGDNCQLEGLSIFENAKLEANVNVASHCVIKNSIVKENVNINAFCNIVERSVINSNTNIKSYTEMINSNEVVYKGTISDEKFIAATAAKIDSTERQV